MRLETASAFDAFVQREKTLTIFFDGEVWNRPDDFSQEVDNGAHVKEENGLRLLFQIDHFKSERRGPDNCALCTSSICNRL